MMDSYRIRRHITILLSLMMIMNLLLLPLKVHGNTLDSKEPIILVIYSSSTGEIDEHQRLLDMLISHFTTHMTFKNSREVTAKDLNDITHLFYYGQQTERLPDSFIKLLASYNGPFVAIGNNVEQLTPHFSFIKSLGLGTYTEVMMSREETQQIKLEPQNILKIDIDPATKTIIEAKKENETYPLFVKHQKSYYYASDDLFPPNSNFLAEVLHEVFAVSHNTSPQAYLRLEDIHPGEEDTAKLMEIARFLKLRNIPYMVSVVPVYVNPKNDQEYHLSDNYDLVETLKYMQNNGGSIIFHGYTDQYGNTETGDGFEFWNEEKNMPIYQNSNDNNTMKTRDFTSPIEYEKYMEEKETTYIEKKISMGIQELADNGLYPVAFEVPHYAMSQNGYKVVSQYFSTLVGQIQLTDNDWRKMTESPYISSPSYLHGMTLLPETIRYVRYEDPTSIQEMKARIHDFTVVRDGVIGGFYHPFLGVKGLVDVVNELDKIPNVKWLDLKEMVNTVKTDTVSIKTENGDIDPIVKRQKSSLSFEFSLLFYLYNLSKDNMLWVMAGSALTLIMTIASIFLLKRTGRTKKLNLND